MKFMNLNSGAVVYLNRRYASTNLHGITSQTTVTFSVNTVTLTVKFVVLRCTILNKIDTALCDDFVTACIGVSACCVVLCLFIYLSPYIKIYVSMNINIS